MLNILGVADVKNKSTGIKPSPESGVEIPVYKPNTFINAMQLPALRKTGIAFLAALFWGMPLFSQDPVADSAGRVPSSLSLSDTTDLDFDFLFDEFAQFLDSLSRPRSYLMAGISMGRGYYSYLNKSNVNPETSSQFTYSPFASYYHKSGFGLNATANAVNDGNKLNLYQFFISPGFDYLKNKRIAAGISYTRYFTRDSLPFYTTPLQNELYAYFTYRKWWVKPSVSVNYGWGNRSDYSERKELITDLRLMRTGYTRVRTEESIYDFSIVTSLRHDFYWLNVLSEKDYIRVTPQINYTSGTQKFGFNQSSNTYITSLRTGSNYLYNSENNYLDDELRFQPLALTFYLRTEYSIGKFYVQPQFILDYYFPASSDNFSTLFSFNAGLVF